MGLRNFPNARESAGVFVAVSAAATLEPYQLDVEVTASSGNYDITLVDPALTAGEFITFTCTTLNSKTVTVTNVWADSNYWTDISLNADYEEAIIFSNGRRYMMVNNEYAA